QHLLEHRDSVRTLYFADETGGHWAPDIFTAGSCMILTGPEGGFSDEERTAIRAAANAVPISLGPRILRAETAALAALAVYMAGAMQKNLHGTCSEAARHLGQCKLIGDRLGLGFLGTGMWPDKAREDLPIMPKGRYAIMLRYMPEVGSLGLDMMLRTCTIQVNLDYASEADMVKKFLVGLALQPVATALFANSPFTEGKPNGYKSFRSHIWEATDADRTG